MITVKKLLVPVDFSEPSAEAMAWAKSLAKKAKSELVLLHSIEWAFEIQRRVETGVFSDNEYETQIRGEIAARLESLSEDFRRDKVSLSIDLTEGKPAIEIIRAINRFDVDLIVMGTHGRTNSSNVLIGSVAEKVARKSSCPVLTVKLPSFKYKPV